VPGRDTTAIVRTVAKAVIPFEGAKLCEVDRFRARSREPPSLKMRTYLAADPRISAMIIQTTNLFFTQGLHEFYA